ncbi:interferon-induced protein with tetratricopeptide repeats 1-like [Seriola aureovittata]|uniref:interferon-induced protein with tetratricopeptide repeats 1-like n=1 Tax=Seriola aureovittata TaxID=2871759 RepID=UPI0024BE48F1|nr:interferon-induced protein with tetratricopeptide repeats 1-like [Seriola aureovittata]
MFILFGPRPKVCFEFDTPALSGRPSALRVFRLSSRCAKANLRVFASPSTWYANAPPVKVSPTSVRNIQRPELNHNTSAAEQQLEKHLEQKSVELILTTEAREQLMMSAAQTETTLEALQCHFTWDLDQSRSKLLRLRDKVEDISTEEGNSWLGHMYNLRGFIQSKLGFTDDARSLFSRAVEAFRKMRNTDSDEGPWLMVNYGNQAWLHHLQGEHAESQAYLSKVDALMKEYPSPSQDELHPEIYAEKAWTLMKFNPDKQLLATDYFQRAIRMQPDMVEWQTSHVVGLVNSFKHSSTGLDADILEKMRNAKEQDPENLHLAVRYLEQLAKKGDRVEDEARELAKQVLRNLVGSYRGIKALLRVYRDYVSIDEAVDLAEEAQGKHPDKRYLKRCLALCYKWKIILFWESRPKQSLIDSAIRLHEEVISLYPHSSFTKRIDLANIYAKSKRGLATSEQMYQELLKRDLEPEDKQLLYNNYAKYLKFERQDGQRSIHYHMKAAAIPQESFFRQNSIQVLQKIKDRSRGQMCMNIEKFLANLQEP